MAESFADALARAKARLDTLDYYPEHLTTRYRSNPYEIEARRAVAETRGRRPSFEGHDTLSRVPTFIPCCGARLLSFSSA